MKQRLTALFLALAAALSLTAGAGAYYESQELPAYLDPGISVTYNGTARTLTDAAGDPVYPLFCNDTVYLPIRAVSELLSVSVDWDEEAQAVLLARLPGDRTDAGDSSWMPPEDGGQEVTASRCPQVRVQYNGRTQFLRDAAGEWIEPVSYGDTTYLPAQALGDLLGAAIVWDEDARTVRIGCSWVELDWSMASSGYIRVRLTEDLADHVLCTPRWYRRGDNNLSRAYTGGYELVLDRWVTIPLLGGSTTYTVAVLPLCDEEEAIAPFRVSFAADLSGFDPDSVFLMSTAYIDFENAPETCAKALEITSGCETDAEKVAAVFQYVAENIEYDHELVERELAAMAANEPVPRRDLVLDHILESGRGVCEHQALLMAGMLRSLGIPCKKVSGNVVLKDGTTAGHAWVAVKPGSGELDLEALGAGTDGEWVRLDPTNAASKQYTSQDENYRPSNYC